LTGSLPIDLEDAAQPVRKPIAAPTGSESPERRTAANYVATLLLRARGASHAHGELAH
jgi:hypothetical protein